MSSEHLLLGNCPLHRRTPFLITNVSHSQFSIARHAGGINYNGDRYFYNPQTDELIRADVVKWLEKQKKDIARQNQPKKPEQMELPT